MNNTCFKAVWASLKDNPDKEFTTVQMRVHLAGHHKAHYSKSAVGHALRQLHKDGVAERIRDGNEPYRYSLANTN